MNSFKYEENRYGKKSVLIIDDDQNMVDLLSKHCRSIGLDVRTTTDGVQAVELMDQGYPDLLILDIDVHACNGKSLLQFLDIEELNWRVPAIVLCKSTDLSSVYRVKTICAYYVHKTPQALNKIEIFANELVDLASIRIDKSPYENDSKSDTL